MGETREQVLSMLRACLLSTKGGVPIANVDRDYRMIVGSRIPYQRLGYHSLEQFLSSIPDIQVSRDHTGEVMLRVIPNKNTEHLAALVSKQKSVPKKHKFSLRNFPPRRTAAASWRPPPVSSASLRLSRRSPPASARRRSPPASARVPLSVTVSNRQENAKGQTFEKPSRMVSFGNLENNMPQSTQQSNSVGVGGKCGKPYQTFEKPPRFLRLSSQDNSSPNPVPVSIPAPVAPCIPSTTMSSSSSKAQDRLQHAIAASEQSSKNKMTNEIKSPVERTITSPLTPLQARLSAAVRKPLQVHTIQPVEEKFAATTLSSAGGGEDFIKRLEEFVESKGMGKPTFKVMPRVSEVGAFYSCYVKIEEFRFSSYPDERPSPGEAMHLAAKQALEELNKLNIGLGGSATQDKHSIMSRISNIVGEHRSGIWSTQIPIDYRARYNESLPDDWLTIMGRCPLVTLEHAAGNRIIVSPNWPPSTDPSNVTVPSSSTSVEIPQGRPLLSPIGPAIPEAITLPESDAWDIYITCGNATDEVWGRLIGEEYSVSYENLATDMEMFYMSNVNIATNPEVGSFYAIKMDDCWHRIELLHIEFSGTEGRVFFIDHGDEEEVSLKELHVLERRFARLPAQAVQCFLWGLEEFADDPKAAHHITETIVGRTLIASVKSRPSADSPAVGVILYDTSTDEDLNMNGQLLEIITKDTMETQLPLEGHVQEMYISHVTNTGDVYLQFESYSYLQLLVSNMVETGRKEDFIANPSKCISPDPSRLYLARYLKDGNWYRAAIINKLQGRNEVEVIFVDFGNTEIINPTDLVVLDSTKSSLAVLPRQAIKVHLHNVQCSSFSERMAARVRELAPCDERVLVKTVSLANTPVVEIFKRIQPDNLLVSISDTLILSDVKSSSKPGTEDSNFRGKKRLERLHSQTDDVVPAKGLSPPHIPDIGEYFDVHVTMAANPGNFTVQPYKDATRLEKMMEEMQSQYKVQKTPPDSNISEGGLYAALHHDNHWYRVCVSRVINENMVSVYFCDYGDVSVLPNDKLQPLMNHFKELPYQAIKAKLAGIQAKHSDWSVEDCLMFQEIVVEHQFVSVIMETGPDLLNPSDTVVGLKLIDTSGEEDVYIDQLLVNQDRAIDIFG